MVYKNNTFFKKVGYVLVMLLVLFLTVACNKKVKVTDIKLDKTELEMFLGDSETIIATILPENATEKTIDWSSDDEEVVTVEDGVIVAVGTGNATVTAKCGNKTATVEVVVEQGLTVEFNVNGGSGITSQKVKEGEKATKPDDPTKDGYNFLGWFKDENLTTAFNFNSIITQDIILYAKWGDNKVTVTFQVNGGSEITSLTIDRGSKVTEPDTPTKDGFAFVGWFEDIGLTTEFDFDTAITENIIIYVKWKDIITYKLAYHLDGGVNNDKNVTEYNIFDLPLTLEAPDKEGYTFLGWYHNGNFTVGPISKIEVAKTLNLYARWELETKVEGDVYCNPDLEKTDVGETVMYKDMSFIYGETAFADLSDALEVATENVYIVGTFTENVTINQSNLNILGPNAFIDANKSTRNSEAVLKGKITVANGVNNLTINGFAFTDTAKITGAGANQNIKFIYNYVYDTKEATTAWLETAGYTSGFFVFANSTNDKLVDFVFQNNKFDNVSDVNINFTRVNNVLVKNNTFTNFDRDAIRFDDGGFNQGKLTFIDNVFSNDELGGYNGIYFRMYGGDQNLETIIDISNNTFRNIGQVNREYYSGAISMRNYQEKDTAIKIFDNKFETCANYINIRNNATAANHEAYYWTCDINYNEFIGLPTTYYFRNWNVTDGATTNPLTTNFEYNYFEDDDGNPITNLEIYADYFKDLDSYANYYQSREEYEARYEDSEKLPTEIIINNPISNIEFQGDYQLDITINPQDAVVKKVTYMSSRPDIVSVSSTGFLKAEAFGNATITIVSDADDKVIATMTVKVVEKERIEVRYIGNGALKVDEMLSLEATIISDSDNLTWISSDESIAVVDDAGVVTALAAGTVNISAIISGTDIKCETGLTVYDENEVNELIQYFIDINTGVIFTTEIYYIGSDNGSNDYLNSVVGTVSDYHFGKFAVQKNMLPKDRPNYPGEVIDIEFVTIHDTANANFDSGALANSNWCNHTLNTGSSWHYTVGNDGVYQQLPDNMKGWHAGDGARKFELIDTGIKSDGDNPIITINHRGFFEVNGKESLIEAPKIAQIAELGIYTTIGDNGNYWMNKTYYNTGYEVIANHGGNSNSIGIETAVDNGSDIYFTWHRAAKLSAELLLKHDLELDRLLYHNNFSGKPCPRSMMTADLVSEFETLVYAEYKIQKEFSDYEIEFTSHNPEILDDTGKIIKAPLETTNVSYTVKVTKGTEIQEITLNALIPGQYNR